MNLRSGIHSRGYLPHVKREGASYFVTFRLADSLPQQVLLEFKRQQVQHLRALASGEPGSASEEEINCHFRRQIERYLDCGFGECHLRRPVIAQIVAEALLHFHNRHYVLHEWVIMPNHVHLVVWPMPNYTLSDHWVRDDEEMFRIRRYIRNNPVKARLCRSPEEWKWGSAYVPNT